MKISIIGTGAYGLALANCLEENKDCTITMWSKFDAEINQLKETHTFKNIKLPTSIQYTTDMQKCLQNTNLIVIAIPVAFITQTIKQLKKYYQNEPILIASKGIEQDTNLFPIDIIKKHTKAKDIGIISGATFATDMLKKEPMGLTLATKSNKLKKLVSASLKNQFLKLQFTKDIIGVELCGSIKNIMAIASGIIEGLEYGESTKHLFITEAIYEIENLITLLGGNPKTILTYAGIDDISMTCSTPNSRNYTLGTLIGKNRSKQEIEKYQQETTIEGLYTAKSFYDLIQKKKINCPFIETIYHILYLNTSPQKIVELLKSN